ncbi:MAG: ATP synthase F1 subunit epsilon [Flavobacteriales bacterium]|nr:ATP synthase F1 subunit epsilon [Flavobacteriales bacterium]|tara:strand:+ start:272 stop:514 length:243 start_codon:yes stop_codon:yes gene_type:complete
MNLEIVTPDSKVYEGEITSIALPGIDGSFQILNNHAPIVSALGTGKMKIVDKENQTQEYTISGGVVEMNNNKVIVLAESI